MSDEKKIIIDEDWKSQVAAEKEALAHEPQSASRDEQISTPDDPAMPPASLELLLSSLATEAMISLGQFPMPDGSIPPVRKNQAKYLIDTIGVIQEKTSGNLTPDEARGVDDLLHQLRMAFVQLT